jgi:hypothetical protein
VSLAQLEQAALQSTSNSRHIDAFSLLLAAYRVLRADTPLNQFSNFNDRLDHWLAAVSKSLGVHTAFQQLQTDTMFLPELDLSSETNPMHFLKARFALGKITPAQTLPIRLANDESFALVLKSLQSIGYEVDSKGSDQDAGSNLIYVRKAQHVHPDNEQEAINISA